MIPALIGALTLIQTLLLTGLSVAREREQGTFDRLLVTPFRPAEIMAEKALPAVLVGIVQPLWSCGWRNSGFKSRLPSRLLRFM